MALGELGYTVDYFYTLTPREFDNACFGYRRAQEAQMQLSWTQTRQIMWAVLTPHQKKGANLTPQKLMQFDWEKDNPDALGLGNDADAAAIAESIAMWEKLDSKKQLQN
jgi:homoserine kinase